VAENVEEPKEETTIIWTITINADNEDIGVPMVNYNNIVTFGEWGHTGLC
jgi:hypothetical protein